MTGCSPATSSPGGEETLLLLIGRFGVFVGAFLTLACTLMAVFTSPGTAEFVISAVTVGIGLVVLSLGLLAILLERKRQQ